MDGTNRRSKYKSNEDYSSAASACPIDMHFVLFPREITSLFKTYGPAHSWKDGGEAKCSKVVPIK